MSLFRNKYFTVCDDYLLEWDKYLSECANCLWILMTWFPAIFLSRKPCLRDIHLQIVIFVGVSLDNLHHKTRYRYDIKENVMIYSTVQKF